LRRPRSAEQAGASLLLSELAEFVEAGASSIDVALGAARRDALAEAEARLATALASSGVWGKVTLQSLGMSQDSSTPESMEEAFAKTHAAAVVAAAARLDAPGLSVLVEGSDSFEVLREWFGVARERMAAEAGRLHAAAVVASQLGTLLGFNIIRVNPPIPRHRQRLAVPRARDSGLLPCRGGG